MITELRGIGFKSWKDTTNLKLAPLTGLFGTNSSGKTSLLQLLLLMKQTVESADRNRVLHLGDERSLVDLGTFYDIVHSHKPDATLGFELSWKLTKDKAFKVVDPEKSNRILFDTDTLTFKTEVQELGELLSVNEFLYSFNKSCFGMQRSQIEEENIVDKVKSSRRDNYELSTGAFHPKRVPGRAWPLPRPVKSYNFPDEATGYFKNTGFLGGFGLAFEELFANVFYLGPLRDYPHRSYVWAGDRPTGVGRRGEDAVAALLAARADNQTFSIQGKHRRRNILIEKHIAEWLKKMDLVHSFALRPIARNRKEYEVKVRLTANSPEVLLTDVGFGVSQILPVLVLCYYVPEGSTVIFEQPEIHLHPKVQADLADVFIEVIKERKVQILVESHSEHLLRRLQRRIAEEKLESKETALYFCQRNEAGDSIAEKLQIDLLGNISNWPKGFFGDEMGEMMAMTEAAMKRRINQTKVGG